MYNIINNQDKLIFIKDLIGYAEKNGLNKIFFYQILKELLPSDNENSLINFIVQEKGHITALFNPDTEQILISVNKINEWLDKNTNNLIEMYNIKDFNTFRIFLSLFVIEHEIAHSNQFLISKGIISAPNKLIENGYKGIFELLCTEDSIFPRPIKEVRRFISVTLYKIKQNFYIIERNANVESTDLLCQLALYMDREDIFSVFSNMKNQFLKIGYTKSNIGCLEETYRNILMYDKYKKFYEDLTLSEEDKLRYGLNISNETRKKILEIRRDKIIH